MPEVAFHSPSTRDAMRTRANNDLANVSHRAADRALHAAYLLREALALLAAEGPLPPEIPGRSTDRLLRLSEVQRLTGLRRSALYEQIQRGVFPRPVKTGRRLSCWSETAIQTWIADRLEGRPFGEVRGHLPGCAS